MRTLVVSDLHLGTNARSDVLRRPELRAPLLARAREADRVVLLGDVIELRHGPAGRALALAEPFLRDLAAAAGDILYVPGNHDWSVLGAWVTRRREQGLDLGLEERVPEDELPPLAAAIASMAPQTRFAYPGAWLREDVYATHGHYSDLHTTVPTLERVAVGVLRRIVTGRAVAGHPERSVAPLYALLHELAQGTPPEGNVAVSGTGASFRIWHALGRRPREDPRVLLRWAGVFAAVKGLERAGIGPLSLDFSGAGLRRGGLRGIGVALDELGVTAPYVVWGHSHRSGPWPGDDPAEWRSPGGSRILNAGSWVYSRSFVTSEPGGSPYWPGTAVWIDETGAPRLERLLGDRTHAELAPPVVREPGPEEDDVSPAPLRG